MTPKSVYTAICAAGVLTLCAADAVDEGARALVQTSLLKKRPAASVQTAVNPLPPLYRSMSRTPPLPAMPDDSWVGITFWRLRAPQPADAPETRLLTLDEETGAELEQVPERIESGSLIKPGERVRLSVEVPRTGYLYVFDREQFRDGTAGPAHLIYPNFQTPRGDNIVAAGRLLEIPDRRDRINSFKLVRSREDHNGEMIMMLVTPQPLTELNSTSRQPSPIEDNILLAWEKKYGLQVDHFELTGGAGQAITAAESRSGVNAAQTLTEADPGPQSVFRVRAKIGQPIFVKLPVRMTP